MNRCPLLSIEVGIASQQQMCEHPSCMAEPLHLVQIPGSNKSISRALTSSALFNLMCL